jgi:hypothetical protein
MLSKRTMEVLDSEKLILVSLYNDYILVEEYRNRRLL